MEAVSFRVPLVTRPNETNRKYLETKQTKMGHLLDLDTGRDGPPRESGRPALAADD